MRNTLVTLTGLALAASLAANAAPASAAGDDRCSAMPREVRAALAKAEGRVADAAARRLKTGEALCRASNARAAAREFQAALKLLDAEANGPAYAGK